MFTQAHNTNTRTCSVCKTPNRPKINEQIHGNKIHTLASYICSNCGNKFAVMELGVRDINTPKPENK